MNCHELICVRFQGAATGVEISEGGGMRSLLTKLAALEQVQAVMTMALRVSVPR